MARAVEVQPTNRVDAQFVAHEFKRLAAKLRWLGDDEDAVRIEQALAKVAPSGFVLIFTEDTD